MFWLILSVHILLCVVLVGLVLLQQGKGAEMGPALGAGSSNTLFGASGATSLVVKLTTGACVAFMVTSVLLIRYYESAPLEGSAPDALQGSVLGDLKTAPPADAPAVQTEAKEGDESAPPAEAASAPESAPAADAPAASAPVEATNSSAPAAP